MGKDKRIKKPDEEMPFYRGHKGGYKESRSRGHGRRQKERNK